MLFTHLATHLAGISRGLARMGAAVPSRCAVCHAWPARPVCDACRMQFAPPLPRCATCARLLPHGVAQCGDCLRHPPPLDACVAAVSYAFPWADLLAQFDAVKGTLSDRTMLA